MPKSRKTLTDDEQLDQLMTKTTRRRGGGDRAGQFENDLIWITRNLFIIDKMGELVRLAFNQQQADVLMAATRQMAAGYPIRLIILKGRQFGTSTGAEALMFTRCVRRRNRKAFVCAHDDESSTNLFRMNQLFNKYLTPKVRKPTEFSSRKEIVWAVPHNSQFRVQTAGSLTLGRSATIQYLHCSEVAFWAAAKPTLLSVLQAVPDVADSMVVLESTANGVGGEFYNRWVQAEKRHLRDPDDMSGFQPVFLSWLDHEDYRLAV